MSGKNKIAIIFEALGIDKVVGSLKNLTSNFSKTNKDIDTTTKSAKTFDDSISKLAQSNTKTGSSFKVIKDELNNFNKKAKENITNTKEQQASYDSLKKVLDEQKEAHNSLVKEALSQTEIKISDIATANNEYMETLKNLQKEYGNIATTSKDFNDIQKEVAGSIKITKDANKDLKAAVDSGNTSFKNIGDIVKKTTKALEEQNTTIGKLKQGFSSFAMSSNTLLQSIGGLVPGVMGVKMGYDALNKVFGDTMKRAYDNSEKMRTSISNMKEYSTTVLKPLNDGFKAIGDTITNYILKPLERDFQVAFINAGDSGKKTLEIAKEVNKQLENEDLEHTKKVSEIKRINVNDTKKMNAELEAEDIRYNEAKKDIAKKSIEDFKKDLIDKENLLIDNIDELNKLETDANKKRANQQSVAGSIMFEKNIELKKATVDRARKDAENTRKNLKQMEDLEKQSSDNSIELQKKGVDASLKVSRTKEKNLGEQVKYLYEFRDIQVRIIKETTDSEIEQAKKIKELNKDVLNQKISLHQTAYKSIIENNGKITDSSITSMSMLEDEIVANQNALNEFSKLAFADTLSEMEAYKVAEIALLNETKAYTNQILSESTELTKTQKKELTNISKETADKEKNIKLQSLQDVSKMYADELKKQVAEGKKASEATVKIYNEAGKEVEVNILSQTQKLDSELKKLKKSQEDMLADLKSKTGEMVSSLGSIAGGINSLIQGSKKAQLESLDAYDEAIQRSKRKEGRNSRGGEHSIHREIGE